MYAYYTYSSSPLKVLPSPAVHPSIKTSFPREAPCYVLRATCYTRKPAAVQQNTWYSGAEPLLLEPANQLLGGRVSPDGNRSAHARKGRPRLQTRRLFFCLAPLNCSSLTCCDLTRDASSRLHAAR